MESISLSEESLELDEGEQVTLKVIIMPEDATNKTVLWSSDNNDVASVSRGTVTAISEGIAVITATTKDGGYTSSCKVIVGQPYKGTLNGHEWVDLGLPSGLKWATCNVGASSPEEYGGYFAWGEVSQSTYYYWTTYKFYTGGDSSDNVTLSKYNSFSGHGTIDNKTTLEISDDVAQVLWDGTWRLPTESEWIELKDNCVWIWTKLSGKNGFKVTINFTGNSIFLLAAGSWYGSTNDDVGSHGVYWSSSLHTKPGSAGVLLFSSEDYQSGGSPRFKGNSVRPVTE